MCYIYNIWLVVYFTKNLTVGLIELQLILLLYKVKEFLC